MPYRWRKLQATNVGPPWAYGTVFAIVVTWVVLGAYLLLTME